MAIISAVYTHVKVNGNEFRVKSFNPQKSADAIDVSQTGPVANSPASPAYGYMENIGGFKSLKCTVVFFADGAYFPTFNEGDFVHLTMIFAGSSTPVTTPGLDVPQFFISELSYNVDVKGAVEVTMSGNSHGYYGPTS